MLMPKLSAEQKRQMIEEIQTYFLEERGEEVGEIAAEICFDFIKDRLGPVFYNAAIRDAREVTEQRMQVLEEDLYALEKQL
ncbi:DUF2164 domain-containing protein [Lederbergia lenta]|uniref:Uncharacterized conserved protein n=1 Tax=Lederbergia lenta TaxID=1467 RepID=A0A2X4WAZ7_LEDLE|nr:DUF2164 domain-containing protein [Lederbergia lenta]MCM3113071.1 DUF2164 domain-containing protein [Lederbergia lenta]MEC2322799.1 DUF2164 domain-containing protein [Lederbergia lenta]SQI61867.1 Uncharacterized conserved protein [Lederbergia lenta]